MLVRSPGWEDPLEKEMATHFSVSTWKIPWTGQPGGLLSTSWCNLTRWGCSRTWLKCLSTSHSQSSCNLEVSRYQVLLRSIVNTEEFLQELSYGHNTLSLTGSGPWIPYSPVRLPLARTLMWASFWIQPSEDNLKISNTFPTKMQLILLMVLLGITPWQIHFF